jgi:hypothetical protein
MDNVCSFNYNPFSTQTCDDFGPSVMLSSNAVPFKLQPLPPLAKLRDLMPVTAQRHAAPAALMGFGAIVKHE